MPGVAPPPEPPPLPPLVEVESDPADPAPAWHYRALALRDFHEGEDRNSAPAAAAPLAPMPTSDVTLSSRIWGAHRK